MAATRVSVTTTPTAVSGLTAGTAYVGQNVGPYPMLLSAQTSTATTDTAAFVIQPYGSFDVERASGESIYVWTSVEHGTTMVYDEAAD